MFDLATQLGFLSPGATERGSGFGDLPSDRMDLYSGEPYWPSLVTVPPSYPELHADIRTDTVIVGGGITGALCAHALIQAGISCIVVDARPIGRGSTCASTALIQYELDTPLHQLVDRVGEQHAVRTYQRCARAVERLGALALEIGVTGFAPRPSVQYASKRGHVTGLVKEQAIRSANGLPCTLLDDSTAIRTVLPFDAPALLHTALAAEMDALQYTHALHTSAMAQGAQVFQHTPVVEFRANGSGITLRTANGCLIKARDLVYATGYGTRDLLPKGVIQLHSTYALVSEARTVQAPWQDRAIIWETASPYLYLRTTDDGRLMVGGRDEPFRAPHLRDLLLRRKTEALERDVERLLPHLPFRTEYAWCGTFGSTKDGLPYIDHAPLDAHSYFALGMGGNGITFSVIAAEMIRDRILGRADKDRELFRFDR